MFRKRYHKQIPELNTTSTADISFMLLIFFLVTSSMDTDKGLLRQMAPPPMEQQQPLDINKDMVVKVEIDAKNPSKNDAIDPEITSTTPNQLQTNIQIFHANGHARKR
jgi:biopolymer transport protein ExbD